MRRNWTRKEIFETPYAQVMLEWDAASFNDYVREHERNMAQIKHHLSSLSESNSSDTSKERRRLRGLLETSQQDFIARAQRFWFGVEEGG
jgi:hypothetical protein